MYRLAKLAGKVLVSNFRDLDAPYRMTMILTYRCQLSCAMCGISGRSQKKELSSGEIARFLERTPHLSWINLSGGEIFLRPDLLEITSSISTYCKDLYLLNFPTNGYDSDTILRTVAEMLRFRFPRLVVTVSIDGPEALHDRIRGVPGSWERAVDTYRGLRRMQSSRFRVSLGMTLQRANCTAFADTVHAVNDRIGGVQYRDLHVNVAHHSAHYYANERKDVIADREQVAAQLGLIRRLRREPLLDPLGWLERQYHKRAAEYLATGRTPVSCQALGASFFLDPSGVVYPCTIDGRPVGALRDHEFRLDGLWRTEQCRSLRREIRAGNCPQCWTPCEAYQSIAADLLPGLTR